MAVQVNRSKDAGDWAPREYKSYQLHNLASIPQAAALGERVLEEMRVVGSVLPFKANNYVVEELIDWTQVPKDPMFVLTFPQKGMLQPAHYKQIAALKAGGASKQEVEAAVHEVRLDLNPHPAGQKDYNVPTLDGKRLNGMQHKYRETVLFFPSQGQTCHAYCAFCFRWPQFVGMDGLKFADREAEHLLQYLEAHPEVQDVLFTGGDPMIMKTRFLEAYIRPLLEANLKSLHTIRIGTKSLSYWPYRFVSDPDADGLVQLLGDAYDAGKHVAIMAHFNHDRELSTPILREAVRRLRSANVQIRTQSPILGHINDSSLIWARMWRKQVDLGMIPYYMFVVRDTGARHYFEMPLERAWMVFRGAYAHVSGVCRTVRGPSMSATPGKVQILGVTEGGGEKLFVLRFLQGRDPDWVHRPFLAKYDPQAHWLDDLEPALGETEFFYEPRLREILERARTGETVEPQEGLVEAE
jgi:KamA family protein